MVRLRWWQWTILALPIAVVVGIVMFASATQLHAWHLDWIWGIFLLVFVGWRLLLSRWLQPAALSDLEATLAELVTATPLSEATSSDALTEQVTVKVQSILQAARNDLPPWENWLQFFQRCQEMVTTIALVYHPQVKRPLLNIYVPQAYRLIRDTVDDVDLWMQKLSPVLAQVTIGQAYEAYDVYQKLEPAARWVWRVWNWSQWVLNPVVAIARASSAGYSNRANQQLLANLGQLVREETLKALSIRAIALYSGGVAMPSLNVATLQPAQTDTLRSILSQTESPQNRALESVNLMLVGRTGAGKSSLINTLFVGHRADVDVLPSTDRLQDYRWQSQTGETLVLWDTPGYEQIGREDLRQAVLEKIALADALLLVTPCTDPAMQMDMEFLRTVRANAPHLPILGVVTQVDRLRPLREWQPPYEWQQGKRPKEISIREAVAYKQSHLGIYCQTLLPLVTADSAQGRTAWGETALSEALISVIEPAKQFRLAQFIQDLDARIAAAAKIIDHYAFQMGSTQGLTALLKSPVLSFLSTMMTGSPTLAIVLAEKLPLEQAPVVLGKLQMAYELFALLGDTQGDRPFDLLALWPLLLETSDSVTQEAWALGHTLAEYWSGSEVVEPGETPTDQLWRRYRYYCQQSSRTVIPGEG